MERGIIFDFDLVKDILFLNMSNKSFQITIDNNLNLSRKSGVECILG
jgi:hypothetical protein